MIYIPPCWSLRQQWPECRGAFQLRDVDITQRVEDKGEEAFHVRRTQTIELIVMLGQGERIARPASVVKGYGIGMARQQQTTSAPCPMLASILNLFPAYREPVGPPH